MLAQVVKAHRVNRASWLLVLILALGGGLRLAFIGVEELNGIERSEFIPSAMSITWDHMPLRMSQHGALPAYVIRASGAIFGNTPVGWRVAGVIAGTATILVLFLIGRAAWSPAAGLIAAGLLAIDRYHLNLSDRATDLPFDLLFVACAMWAFTIYLKRLDDRGWKRARWLCLAALFTGLGFLCKELTALLAVAFGASLLVLRKVASVRARDVVLALLTGALVIAPDVYANLTTDAAGRAALARHHHDAEERLGTRANSYVDQGLYMSYGDQLSRFHGIGLNLEPFYFYFGDLFDAAGIRHTNSFSEAPYEHPAASLVLWFGVIASAFRRPRDRVTVFLLTTFVVMFVPFALVQLGTPRGNFQTDPIVLWYWVDRTALPAMLLCGSVLAGWLRRDKLPAL